ncbi:MAG: RNA polymerase sigma factor [Candidatus Paceibacterota bacterium]
MAKAELIHHIHYPAQSDEDLAEMAGRQDNLAFQELANRYIKAIFNFSRQYMKNKEDAEDTTQETFYKAWKNIRQYQQGKAFRPWLYAIARNTSLDSIKKKKALVFSAIQDNENDLAFEETLRDLEPLPDSLFENKTNLEALTKALESLHPDQANILILHYRDELTFQEIAEVIGSPMNTVKSWHHRALIKLRRILKEMHHM